MTPAPRSHRLPKIACFVAVVFAIAALMVGVALYYPDLHRAKAVNYAGAVLTVRDYAPIRSTKITLDAASANHLAGFFPQLASGKKSRIAGAWMPTVEVQFQAADGAVTHVASNFDVWSEGRGDWAAQPGLEAYVLSIRRVAEHKKSQ